MKKVLIAYYTKTNTTKEVAEEIKSILGENDFQTDILRFPDVKSIEGYDAVIIGSPINGMQWYPDALRFIENNKESLMNTKTVYYLVSYLLKNGKGFWQKIIRGRLKKAGSIVAPVKTGMFGGRIPEKMPKIMNIMFGVKKDAPLDSVDWENIRKWSKELSEEL